MRSLETFTLTLVPPKEAAPSSVVHSSIHDLSDVFTPLANGLLTSSGTPQIYNSVFGTQYSSLNGNLGLANTQSVQMLVSPFSRGVTLRTLFFQIHSGFLSNQVTGRLDASSRRHVLLLSCCNSCSTRRGFEAGSSSSVGQPGDRRQRCFLNHPFASDRKFRFFWLLDAMVYEHEPGLFRILLVVTNGFLWFVVLRSILGAAA